MNDLNSVEIDAFCAYNDVDDYDLHFERPEEEEEKESKSNFIGSDNILFE